MAEKIPGVVTPIYCDGDPRLDVLKRRLKDVIDDFVKEGNRIPAVAVVGVLEMIKLEELLDLDE